VKRRIFFHLVLLFTLVIAAIILILGLTVTHSLGSSLRRQIEINLRQNTAMFALRVAAAPLSSSDLKQTTQSIAESSGARATIIDIRGHVLADSLGDIDGIEAQVRHPEFQAALAGQVGSDIRGSNKSGADFLYVAQPVPGGAVRLAVPLTAIARANSELWHSLGLAFLLAWLIAVGLSAVASKEISARLERMVVFAGKIAEGDFSARLSEYQNDEIGMVATALDATARKLQTSFQLVEDSRNELEAVLNGMQEPVIAISRDGRAQWANRRMEMVTPTGIRLGQPVVQTVRDPNFLAIIQEASQHHKLVTARVNNFVPGRVFAATVAPMPSGGLVAVLHDLTEAESIERTRRDFIANVSHELRTPLTSIQGYAETLLDGVNSDETLRDFLEIIRKNAQRMARLTEDLLILARVESGDKKLQLRPVAAAELLRDASDYFHDHCADSGMTFEVVNEALKMVSADRDAIFQVFSNLIDNASKYASQGGRILIGAHDVEGFVQFYVRDFGPGIASEHLPRLFERFYRVDKARSRESGGTGLGLAIAKHIMLAHGGSITAESELNHGCTFVFSLLEARVSPMGDIA
jgi:two-component system phosphate regulon sensor histidine kinase PhoR